MTLILVLNVWWCKADVAAGEATEFNLTATRNSDTAYS